MRPDQELRYLAGLFDGEGCLSFAKNRNGFVLTMSVDMTDQEGIVGFVEMFGGKLREYKRKNNRKVYRWVVTDQNCKTPLRRLLPHLRVKQDQARVGLEYLKWRGKGHQGKATTKEQLEKAREFRNEFKRLKIPGQGLEQGDSDAKR